MFFNGDSGKKRQISLGGKKEVGKDELLEKARREREERQAQRERLKGATTIQSFSRSVLASKKLRASLRATFDARCASIATWSLCDIHSTIRDLVFFFDITNLEDKNRLFVISEALLTNGRLLDVFVTSPHSDTLFVQSFHLISMFLCSTCQCLFEVGSGKVGPTATNNVPLIFARAAQTVFGKLPTDSPTEKPSIAARVSSHLCQPFQTVFVNRRKWPSLFGCVKFCLLILNQIPTFPNLQDLTTSLLSLSSLILNNSNVGSTPLSEPRVPSSILSKPKIFFSICGSFVREIMCGLPLIFSDRKIGILFSSEKMSESVLKGTCEWLASEDGRVFLSTPPLPTATSTTLCSPRLMLLGNLLDLGSSVLNKGTASMDTGLANSEQNLVVGLVEAVDVVVQSIPQDDLFSALFLVKEVDVGGGELDFVDITDSSTPLSATPMMEITSSSSSTTNLAPNPFSARPSGPGHGSASQGSKVRSSASSKIFFLGTSSEMAREDRQGLSNQLSKLFEAKFVKALFDASLCQVAEKQTQQSHSSGLGFGSSNPFLASSNPKSPFSFSPSPSPFGFGFSQAVSTPSSQPPVPGSILTTSTTKKSFAYRICSLYSAVLRHLQLASEKLNSVFGNETTHSQKLGVTRVSILNTLVFVPGLVKKLWTCFREDKNADPVLTMFSICYSHLLEVLDDSEFYGSVGGGSSEGSSFGASGGGAVQNVSEFSMREVAQIAQELKNVVFKMYWLEGIDRKSDSFLRSVLTKLVRLLYNRDCQRQFCPRGSWTCPEVDVATFGASLNMDSFEQQQKLGALIEPSAIGGGGKSISSAGLSVSLSEPDAKCLCVLLHLPFVVPFEHRLRIFDGLIDAQRERLPGGGGFYGSPVVTVRRPFIVEDGYTQLNRLGADLKNPIRVRFINEEGEEEAGIGQGVTKEFISEFVKHAFEASYGLFKYTHENLLYPNPASSIIFGADHLSYFEFLGRVLGKAMFDNVLVELPFARFFLSKLLGNINFLNDLGSLDADLHKNLLFVKTYPGDVQDLVLTFSVTENELGAQREVDLIPNGRHTSVTNENKLSYVYRVANYKLNVQIRPQSAAFLKGFRDVIPQQWISMFNTDELQSLISGSTTAFDVTDLKKHAQYSGGFTSEHPTIRMFWQVVEGMDAKQRSMLLKFVTSCSRAPILGFKDLYPPFNIHQAHDDTRLPTSSTCINQLKLPPYKDMKSLKEKLMYAITSSTGFDLS